MSINAKFGMRVEMSVVQTVAAGTPWERSWDLGVVADTPPRSGRLERLRWRFKRWRCRRQIEREIAAYRLLIARNGCTPAILEEAARRANSR